MNVSKLIGSTMIFIGTIIGAGMLAMPLVSASLGFIWSLILLLILWVASTITGLLVVEVNLTLPANSCSFSSMAKHTLGNFGKVITWVSYLFLLYAIIVAYVIGGSNLIASTITFLFHIQIPNWICAILFTLILGIAVFWSTKTVDYFNRNLMSLKGLLLLATLILIVPHIDINKLIISPHVTQLKYLWGAVPVFVCAFCYHFVIPSLRIYIGDKPSQLKMLVIISTTFSLIVYVWWIASAFGVIPLTGENSFISIAHDPKPPSELVQLITLLVNNKWVTTSINGFANIALTTAFLGVALGLFDFLADGLKRPDTRFGRLQTASLTFIPPLIFGVLYPTGFVKAINYASISVAILSLILPVTMTYYLRKNQEVKFLYRVKCGNIGLILIFLLGIVTIILAILFALNLLPEIK
ncbi:MAG: hypothetical protein LBL17_00065 [Coxiellaceae bacterium]|jgi:aromatic amino acid transport protein|nr:hypothetical protein [Coxiellaceae bacterium]